ncbi:alpha-keto acid decarboxylase family protein [Cruoricaptor ignavus]|uniref:alpha-keto acid decarboxylase family protein n=1 Tax=Cruoricaptor ignavus TaxID=1118202 RepID=UPI00370CFEE5
MAKTTIGKYLASRLEEIGLKYYFTVPGDYNLTLLDELISNKNMQYVGNCNELNSAYAAEGYARANGAGAMITTFNVGAFSALNGIVSAYAERLPVIFVCSAPNSNDIFSNRFVHHSIATHDFSYQFEMIKRVTCVAERILHAENAPRQIDNAIRTAIRERKPAYIEIPANLSTAECSVPQPLLLDAPVGGNTPLAVNEEALIAAVKSIAEQLNKAEKPVLLAGPHLRSFGAVDAFRRLAEALGCAVAVMPNAKSFFPEDHPQFIGVYLGKVSSPGCDAIMEWSDMILAAGAVFTDYSTVGWTMALPEREKMIDVRAWDVQLPEDDFTNVPIAKVLEGLAEYVNSNKTSLEQYNRESQIGKVVDYDPQAADERLSRAEMVNQIEHNLIDANTTLIVETGDSWFNGMYMKLPSGAGFEIEMQYGSIGWSLPASLGYALGAEPGRRTVLLIGDGSFQLTAQEISKMIELKQEIIMVLVNNYGYVIESAIHEGPYNYYQNWDYAALMKAFNGNDGNGLGLTAATAGELADAIAQAKSHKGGPVLIECQIEHDDYTKELITWGSAAAEANAREPKEI